MKVNMKSENIYNQKGGEKKMKHLRIILALCVTTFVLSILVWLPNTWAKENVRMTKHNLSTNPNILAQGTTEVCIFCHTPHGGDTTVGGGAAPLWNRTLSSATYVLYDSPNFDGISKGQPQGVSKACLSCHDGTVAFDSLINFGGSGSTPNITGFNGALVDPTTKAFKASAGPFPNLGYPLQGGNPDLSNDHPISMEIPCGKDPQFDEVCNNLTAGDNATQSPAQVKYLFRGASSTLPGDIRDRIRAYPTVSGKAYIECASCHNPHEASRPGNDGSTATDTNNSRFLRYPSVVGTTEEAILTSNLGDRNAGSLLCLSCHQK